MKAICIILLLVLICPTVLAESRNNAGIDKDNNTGSTEEDVRTVSARSDTQIARTTSEQRNEWRDARGEDREALYTDARQELETIRNDISSCESSTTTACKEVRQRVTEATPPLILGIVERVRVILEAHENNTQVQELARVEEQTQNLPSEYTYEQAGQLREHLRETIRDAHRAIAAEKLEIYINRTQATIDRADKRLEQAEEITNQFAQQGKSVENLGSRIARATDALSNARTSVNGATGNLRELETTDNLHDIIRQARLQLHEARDQMRTFVDTFNGIRNEIERLNQAPIDSAPEEPVEPTPPEDLSAAFTMFDVDGMEIFAWYPTVEQVSENMYFQNITSTVGKDAAIANGEFPVVLFSHGFFGCAAQSAWLTEEIARNGYVVLAVNHDDALCDDGLVGSEPAGPSLLEPQLWNESSFVERKNDFDTLLQAVILERSPLANHIDTESIAVMGHSLGGYTALGYAGGWDSWKNDDIDAALLLSPYSMPFVNKTTLPSVNVPVMIQGAVLDLGITPFQQAVYDELNSPKYFVVLTEGLHFAWTVLPCGDKTMTACLEQTPQKRSAEYSIQFLDKYLKGTDVPALTEKRQGVFSYVYEE